MPFDPTQPAYQSPNSSAVMRGQLNALKDLIDAIPEGPPGPEGPIGPVGSSGENGAPGPQGEPGEVTAAQLGEAVARALVAAANDSSANSNGVELLGLVVSDPPTRAEVQAVADQLDAVILALRR